MEAFPCVPGALEYVILVLQAREELVKLVVMRAVDVVRQL